MININEGSVKSTIAFYNYGTVGQNEIDHCVGVNNYDDMVIPEMEFTSNDPDGCVRRYESSDL